MELFLMIIASFLFSALSDVEAHLVTATIYPNRNYNAPLDVNSMVRFNCTGTGTIIEWTVNGTSAKDPIIQSRGVTTTPEKDVDGGVFFSSLFIRASKENNNTSIRCTTIRIVSVNPEVLQSGSSKLIILNIRRLWEPPPNQPLSQADESCTRTLSWDAPKTLDLTDIVSDILYYTVCSNLIGGKNCTNISSNGETVVEFTFCNVSVSLLFTVTAPNVIGEGNDNSVIYLPSGRLTIMRTDTITPEVPTSGRVSNRPSGIGSTVGGILFGVIFVAAVLLAATMIVLFWKYKKKRSKDLRRQSTVHLLESIEMDGGKGNTSTPTETENFYETIVMAPSQERVTSTDAIESKATSSHKLDTAKQRDSPTSPLDTEIMGKYKSKLTEVSRSPQALRDDVKNSDANEVGLPMNEDVLEVCMPKLQFTKEDMNLSKEEEVSVLSIN